MAQPWDNARRPGQQGPGYGPPATPPQWGQGTTDPWAPSAAGGAPRQGGTGGYPPGMPPQPAFTPGPQAYQQQPPPQYQPPQYAPQPPQAPRASRKGWAAIGCLGLFGVIVLIGAVAGAHSSSSSSAPAAPAATQAAQPAAAASSAPAKAGPAGTVSQMQALATAENYLGDGQGFSRQGLIDQLDSSYGNSFSVADATWAVDHSDANWNDQAVDCAKNYMRDGQGFSRQGLIQQMTSAYGNKFTEAQATYAANAVGL